MKIISEEPDYNRKFLVEMTLKDLEVMAENFEEIWKYRNQFPEGCEYHKIYMDFKKIINKKI